MPGWLGILAQLLGCGIVAGFVVALSHHTLQLRRDREQETREAQRAWAAHQRQLCLDLLRAVNGFHALLLVIRSLHDHLESRLAAKELLEAPRLQLYSWWLQRLGAHTQRHLVHMRNPCCFARVGRNPW